MHEDKLVDALSRCRTVLANMVEETAGFDRFLRRWEIPHEPLRADAKNLLPIIDAALFAARPRGDSELLAGAVHPDPDVQFWREHRAALERHAVRCAELKARPK